MFNNQGLFGFLRNTRFWVAVFVLGSSICFLNPAVDYLQAAYVKNPMPIRKTLKSCVPILNCLNGYQPKSIEARDSDLGTDEYTLVIYNDNGYSNIKQALLFVTFYNDPKDKVPHTPDVCGRQAGNVITGCKSIEIAIPGVDPARGALKANQFITEKSGTQAVDVYFFVAQGYFKQTRNQVRWQLCKPGDRSVYFSKIEVQAVYSPEVGPEAAAEKCKEMLKEAVPLILNEYLPIFPSNEF